MVRCLDLNILYTFRVHLIILLFKIYYHAYYLNEVDKGGQTAVLMADNITITPDVSNLNEL